MYREYGLVLMINHACNLRCTYCYTGRKFDRRMSDQVARKAINRALASVQPGGVLELGFFGGEPLLEARLMASLIDYAREKGEAAQVNVLLSLTTNGTLTDPVAWKLMLRRDLDLTISFDGLSEVHDRHHITPSGQPSSTWVVKTMKRLLDVGKPFVANVVVHPATVDDIPDGVRYLRKLGVSHVNLSLDLWSDWEPVDLSSLEAMIARCAQIWHEGLPDFGINWFDEKALRLSGASANNTARCGFGAGEIAVAPSGALYPCERLIGADEPDNPMRLGGHVTDGHDFLGLQPFANRSYPACESCAIQSACSTTCRCSNYIRTGDVSRPDRLLCVLNEACLHETSRFLVPSHALNPV